MLITEAPYYKGKIALYARRNGVYDRPVVGYLADLKAEDSTHNKDATLVIAKLPDIIEAQQVNKYLVGNFFQVSVMNMTIDEVNNYVRKGALELPIDESSPHWSDVGGPWYQYAMLLDTNGQYIKAPMVPNDNEPSAEEIDERIDEFPENRGILEVTSPLSLAKQTYRDKLAKV